MNNITLSTGIQVGNLILRSRHNHAGDVYRQVAVALEEVGEREGEEGYRKHEDGVERLVVEVQLVDDIRDFIRFKT